MKMYTYIFEMGYLSDCVPVQPAPAVPYNGNSCNYEQCVDYKSFIVSLSTIQERHKIEASMKAIANKTFSADLFVPGMDPGNLVTREVGEEQVGQIFWKKTIMIDKYI